MRDPFYANRAAEIAANILTAQCRDLGLGDIQQYADGTVSAALRGVTFRFGWNVMSQSATLISRVDPREAQILELAA